MARKVCVVVVFLAVIAVTGDTLRAQDAREVLQAAVKAMGAANVKTIQYSGTGWNAAVGQSFSPQDDWPHFEVTRYTRTIDYDAKSSREELTRRQGNNPPRGGGGTPLQGEQQQVAIVSGNSAWNMDGQNAVPQAGQYLAGVPVAEFRQLDILLTPHGFLKAAQAGYLLAAAVITGRDHAEWKSDAGFIYCDGEIQSQWNLQRSEYAGAGPNLGCQPRVRRHAV